MTGPEQSGDWGAPPPPYGAPPPATWQAPVPYGAPPGPAPAWGPPGWQPSYGGHPGPAPYGGPPYGYGYPPPGGLVLPPGMQLAPPGARLGAALLNTLLVVVTLVVGYLVWTVVLWNQGTNPGKKMLGIYTRNARTGQRATWGEMCVRNLALGQVAMFVASSFTFGILPLVDVLFIFGERHQRLIDRMTHLVHTRE